MAIRVSLWDPDKFLNRFPGLIGLIWSKWGAGLWLAVVLPAAFLILPHWPELSHNFSDRLLALDNLVVLYFVFPLLKAFHEMGHATATKARGGEVHDLGIILLVMLPVPYVEASAASTFRSKYQRALVGAAGVAVELFIAAIAFYLWLLIEPGVFRAGPVQHHGDRQRLHPDLQRQPAAALRRLLHPRRPDRDPQPRRPLAALLVLPAGTLPAGRDGTRAAARQRRSRRPGSWSTAPPPRSTASLVTILIALFIAGRFFFIGVLLAIWAFAAMAILPVVRTVRHLTSSPACTATVPERSWSPAAWSV